MNKNTYLGAFAAFSCGAAVSCFVSVTAGCAAGSSVFAGTAEQAVGLHMVIVLLVDEHVRDADAERDIEDGERRVQ